MKKIIAFLSLTIFLASQISELHAHTTVSRFRANLSAAVVQPQKPSHASSTATAVAEFVLTYNENDPSATTLTYNVQFNGLDLAPSDNDNLLDDITAIHIHDTTVCANASLCGDGMGGQIPGSTAGTRHVLNIFGMPRGGDDDDVQAFADDERITGIWEPTDANDLMPAPTQSIADPAILDLLFAGDLAVMVHTNLVPTGEIGGFILQVPEPGSLTLALITLGMLGVRRRQ